MARDDDAWKRTWSDLTSRRENDEKRLCLWYTAQHGNDAVNVSSIAHADVAICIQCVPKISLPVVCQLIVLKRINDLSVAQTYNISNCSC